MKGENLIHVKLEYMEAVESKKDVLSAERDFLKLLKAIKRYHLLRTEESKLKDKIAKKMKELKTSLSKLQHVLPNIEVPKFLQEDHEEKDELSYSTKKENKDTDLESQIREIQDRLKKLQ